MTSRPIRTRAKARTLKLPFDDVAFFSEALNSRSVTHANLAIWIKQNVILDRLKDWKTSDLDDPDRYAAIEKALGPSRSQQKLDLAENAKKVEGYPRDLAASEANPENADLRRWVMPIRDIIDRAPPPGRLPLEINGDDLSYQYLTVLGLLLTVIRELQDDPEGWFAERLGGPSIAKWPSTPEEERKVKSKRALRSQSKDVRGAQEGVVGDVDDAATMLGVPREHHRKQAAESFPDVLSAEELRIQLTEAHGTIEGLRRELSDARNEQQEAQREHDRRMAEIHVLSASISRT